MRKRLELNLTKQEANLIKIWAIKDAKLAYASHACKSFDNRIVDKIDQTFGIK